MAARVQGKVVREREAKRKFKREFKRFAGRYRECMREMLMGEVVLRSASTDEEERKNRESEGSEYEVLEYGIFKRKRSADDDLFVRPSESVGSSTRSRPVTCKFNVRLSIEYL